MKAQVGDELVVKVRHVGDPDRTGVIIEVIGEAGGPPYLVRWSDGHESSFYPTSGPWRSTSLCLSGSAPGRHRRAGGAGYAGACGHGGQRDWTGARTTASPSALTWRRSAPARLTAGWTGPAACARGNHFLEIQAGSIAVPGPWR